MASVQVLGSRRRKDVDGDGVLQGGDRVGDVARNKVAVALGQLPRFAADLEAGAASGDVPYLLVLVLVNGDRRALRKGDLDQCGAVAAGQGATDYPGEHL